MDLGVVVILFFSSSAAVAFFRNKRFMLNEIVCLKIMLPNLLYYFLGINKKLQIRKKPIFSWQKAIFLKIFFIKHKL